MDDVTDVPDSPGPQETLRALVEELQLFLRSELSTIIGFELARALAKELPLALESSSASLHPATQGNGHLAPGLSLPEQKGSRRLTGPGVSPRPPARPSKLPSNNRLSQSPSNKRLSLQSQLSVSSDVQEKISKLALDDAADDDLPFLCRKPKMAKELYEEFKNHDKPSSKDRTNPKVKGPQKQASQWGVARKFPNHPSHPDHVEVADESDRIFQPPKSALRDSALATAPGLTLEDAEPPMGAPAELMLAPHETDISDQSMPITQVTTVHEIPGAIATGETEVVNGDDAENGENGHRSLQRQRARYSGDMEANEGGFRDLRAMYLKKRGKNMEGGEKNLSMSSYELEGGTSKERWKRSISGMQFRPQCGDFQDTLDRIVKSTVFSAVTTFLLIFNAVSIGVQTNWMAQNRYKKSPAFFEVVEIFFCFAFSVELALRIAVHRRDFFCSKEWSWNWFDFFLVFVQIVEVLLILTIGSNESEEDDVDTNVSFLRVLRVLRLIRVARVVRVIRLISELRTIIASVANSMKSLLSTMVLIGALVYMTGVFLTQLVTDKLKSHPEDTLATAELEIYYSSLPLACLMLFQSFTSGVDWAQACTPLMEHISPFMGILFVFFIAFVVFAMLNVITGVFVDSAVQSTAEEKDAHMVSRLHTFLCKDDAGDGLLTWEKFQARLDDPEIQLYFKTVDLDISEARGLFQLLDAEQNGAVEAEEFVMGCLRLRGQAKAIDLATLMYESRRWHKRISKNMRKIETQNGIILEVLEQAPSDPPTPKRPISPAPIVGEEMAPRTSTRPVNLGMKKLKTFIADA